MLFLVRNKIIQLEDLFLVLSCLNIFNLRSEFEKILDLLAQQKFPLSYLEMVISHHEWYKPREEDIYHFLFHEVDTLNILNEIVKKGLVDWEKIEQSFPIIFGLNSTYPFLSTDLPYYLYLFKSGLFSWDWLVQGIPIICFAKKEYDNSFEFFNAYVEPLIEIYRKEPQPIILFFQAVKKECGEDGQKMLSKGLKSIVLIIISGIVTINQITVGVIKLFNSIGSEHKEPFNGFDQLSDLVIHKIISFENMIDGLILLTKSAKEQSNTLCSLGLPFVKPMIKEEKSFNQFIETLIYSYQQLGESTPLFYSEFIPPIQDKVKTIEDLKIYINFSKQVLDSRVKLKEYKLACCSRTQFIFNEVKSYEIMFK